MKNIVINEEILAASYWENFKYLKELSAMKSPKSEQQRVATNQIREEWIEAMKNRILN